MQPAQDINSLQNQLKKSNHSLKKKRKSKLKSMYSFLLLSEILSAVLNFITADQTK